MSRSLARSRADAPTLLGAFTQDRLAGADVRLAVGAAAAWLSLALCADLSPAAIVLT